MYASTVNISSLIIIEVAAFKIEASNARVLGTDIVLNDVPQSLLDISWFTFVIIKFKASGYCFGKNLWLIDKALYILIPANPSIVKLKSAGIKPTIFEGLFSTLYI